VPFVYKTSPRYLSAFLHLPAFLLRLQTADFMLVQYFRTTLNIHILVHSSIIIVQYDEA